MLNQSGRFAPAHTGSHDSFLVGSLCKVQGDKHKDKTYFDNILPIPPDRTENFYVFLC